MLQRVVRRTGRQYCNKRGHQGQTSPNLVLLKACPICPVAVRRVLGYPQLPECPSFVAMVRGRHNKYLPNTWQHVNDYMSLFLGNLEA